MNPRPIGIFGGIFDPVHNGHSALVNLARDFFSCERIVVVPSGNPPHKHDIVARPDQRLNMLRLALGQSPDTEISQGELTSEKTSYTIETLEHFKQCFPHNPLYLIIGADNLSELSTWRRFSDIVNIAVLCVANRPGFDTEIPECLKKAQIKTFPSPEWGLSSRLVRQYLQNGYSCRNLVCDKVLGYISREGLYK